MPRERQAILASLPSKGFTLEDGKDHYFLRFHHRGLTTAVYTKVSRGKEYKDYGDFLLAKMSRQLKISRAQLNDLIDCPLDELGYVDALRSAGVIADPTPKQDLPDKRK